MTKHEKLNEICKKIGYEYEEYEYIQDADISRRRDVREIIFTQEFMDKFCSYLHNKGRFSMDDYTDFCVSVINNLDNPTDKLYKLN